MIWIMIKQERVGDDTIRNVFPASVTVSAAWLHDIRSTFPMRTNVHKSCHETFPIYSVFIGTSSVLTLSRNVLYSLISI